MNTSESYRKADVECEHGQFKCPDKQYISRPPRDLNFRATRPVQLVSTVFKYHLMGTSVKGKG